MPVNYQGNKGKYAGAIYSFIRSNVGRDFFSMPLWEACCGTASVSFHIPKRTNLIDLGPWGKYWSIIHRSTLNDFLPILTDIPEELYEPWVRSVKCKVEPKDPVEWAAAFLALQRESFSGKPVSTDGGCWKHPGWNSGFSHKSWDSGIRKSFELSIDSVHNKDVNAVNIPEGSIVYIDPDYADTSGYGGRVVDLKKFVRRNNKSHIFISYDRDLSESYFPDCIHKDITNGRRSTFSKSIRECIHYIQPATNL